MKKYILTGLILMSFLFALSGCGGDGGAVTAPPGTIVKFLEGDLTINDATSWDKHEAYFTISVTDENGIPLSDVLLWISYQWAVPDPDGTVELYNADTNAFMGSPASVSTDKDGLFHLKFVFISGLVGEDPISYTGDLKAQSGQAIDTVKVSIN